MEHKQFKGTRPEFVKTFGNYIYNITKGTGILPETLIAQAILESSGKYGGSWLVGGSKLSREANNFFGIKCGSSWNGDKYEINTTEWNQKGGYYYNVNACFRKYRTVEDSIKNYVEFLQKNQRYKKALEQKTIKTQAKELQKAGYATSPDYAELVYKVYLTVKNDIQGIKKENKTFEGFNWFIPLAVLSLLIIFEE